MRTFRCSRKASRNPCSSLKGECRAYAIDPVLTTSNYLRKIGVPSIPPSTSPFDPGYDPATLESHLEQSSHLMSTLKISMACWVANGLRHAFRVGNRIDVTNVPTLTIVAVK